MSMNEPDLAVVAAFLALADRGGFAAAARELGVTQSTVSRRIAALEQQIGARLVMRTTRRVALTEAGAAYAGELREVLAGLRDAHARVRHRAAEPEGLVRLTMPTALGRTRLVPLVAALYQRHPKLRFDLDLSDRYVDMLDGSYDIAVRIADSTRSGLRSERIGSFGVKLYAAPAYAAAHGLPQNPEQLAEHAVLALRTYSARTEWQGTWRGKAVTVQITPTITATDSFALKTLTLAGAGLTVLPSYLIDDELRNGTLLEAIPDLALPEREVFATYLSHRAEITKIQTTLQALRDGLADR